MSTKVSAKGEKAPSVYLSHGLYYFKVTVDGERQTVPTGCSDKTAAEGFRTLWLEKTGEKPKANPENLGALLTLFSKVETNPKLKDSKETGISYTERYARYEGTRSQHILELTGPEILSKKLDKLTKADLEVIRRNIHKTYGNRPVAHDTFRTLKTVLNFAYGKGWMKNMVGFHMPGIKATKSKKKLILPVEDIRAIYQDPTNFRNDTDRDIFYVLASTGLRRAELAAIQGKQVRRALIKGREIDVLEVSQSFKDANYSTLGAPKWEVERIIPIAPSTAKILRKHVTEPDAFLFHMGNSQWSDMFDYIRAHVDVKTLEAPEALPDLTAHKLRHRLNTTLLEEDINELLVQEYLSWHHQDANKIQAGYTHLYLKSLIEVSDKIEELLGLDKMEEPSDDDFMWLD